MIPFLPNTWVRVKEVGSADGIVFKMVSGELDRLIKCEKSWEEERIAFDAHLAVLKDTIDAGAQREADLAASVREWSAVCAEAVEGLRLCKITRDGFLRQKEELETKNTALKVKLDALQMELVLS